MPEQQGGRETRYRQLAEQLAAERDQYRESAIQAVGWLIAWNGDDCDVLDGDDLTAAKARALDLRTGRDRIRQRRRWPPTPVG